MWNLIVHAPDSDPQPHELKNGKTSIGRAVTNDIVVDDAAASRHHAEIRRRQPDDFNRGLDSCGTFINHARMSGMYIEGE
jgi:pSer/pThr/pTyr-binding forkhead associated (FHA) protein